MKRAPILVAGHQVSDQVDQGPTQLLSDEKERPFKDRFQIFGRPITGQARQAEPRHIAGSHCDTEKQGESRAL